MTGFTMVAKAFTVARQAHKGQKDNAGNIYIFHPIRVALLCKGTIRKTVALLHDVIEDTKVTERDLLDHGFPREVVDAVAALSRGEKEQMDAYIGRVCKNPIAMDVKIADTRHNLSKSLYYAKNHKSAAEQNNMHRRARKYEKQLARLTTTREALAQN